MRINLPQPQIGIWGAKASGKSSYLVALMPEFQRRHRRPDFDWNIVVTDQATVDFLNGRVDDFQRGIFPPSTDALSPDLYEFILTHPREGRITFKMMETAGGLIEDAYDDSGYFSTLTRSQGLLLFFDCMKNKPADREKASKDVKLLIEYLENSQNSAKLYLAFCVTKLDQHPHWRSVEMDIHNYVREKLIGKEMHDRLRAVCPNKAKDDRSDVCAISIPGRLRDGSWNVERVNNGAKTDYRISDMKHWEPHEMLRPLFYLINRIRSK